MTGYETTVAIQIDTFGNIDREKLLLTLSDDQGHVPFLLAWETNLSTVVRRID